MADSTNERRPVRKLTVKNFSVIKEAELEFGKITVLIGPQASGKSLLCKLAYFLGGEIPGFAVESLLDSQTWDGFLEAVAREFSARFSTSGWLRTSFRAEFLSQRYQVNLAGVGDPISPGIDFLFCEEFKKLYEMLRSNPAKQPGLHQLSRSELRQDLWVEISLLLNQRRNQANIYIPSGRALFAGMGSSVSTLQNPDLDPITQRFAGQIPWDTRWKPGLVSTGRGVTQGIEQEMYRIARGTVAVVDGKRIFISADGRTLPLSLQSSGTLELLPMFSVLNYLAYHQEHIYGRWQSAKISPLADVTEYGPFIYLEEPESSLFPQTQYELVNLFAWMSNDEVLSFDWVITTHSPYVLSVFADLVKAGKVGNESQDYRIAVAKVIPERYWIKPEDFAAYKIDNGRLQSIFDRDTGQIDGDYLDNISGKISDELGQLLEIQYGK